MRFMNRAVVASCVTLAMCASARADLVNFTLLPSPDIFSDFVDIDYVGGTFTPDGIARNLEHPFETVSDISSGEFLISATIGSNGVACDEDQQFADMADVSGASANGTEAIDDDPAFWILTSGG